MNRIVRAAAVLGVHPPKNVRQKLAKIAAIVMAFVSVAFPNVVSAATLAKSSLSLSTPVPSATGVSYTFTGGNTGGLVSSTVIKCVKVVVANASTGDVAPTGFSGASAGVDATNSTLVNSSATSWSLATSDGTSSTGQKNVLKYTNSGSGITPSTTTNATFVVTGLVNPSTADTAYYYHIDTYGATDCSASPVDTATVEFINTNGSTLSLTIDNTLTFSVAGVSSGTQCAGTGTGAAQTSTGTTLPFGAVTASSNSYACQDLSAATNSANGYTIYARYTAKPTNALNQTIADVSPGTNPSPQAFSASGTEAYGYTTNDQTLSTTGDGANRFFDGTTYKWSKMTNTNAEVGYESAGVTSTTYRVSHQVGVSLTTFPGTYTTTVVYTCTPVY